MVGQASRGEPVEPLLNALLDQVSCALGSAIACSQANGLAVLD